MARRMHRTQIYLNDDCNEALGRMARARGTSKSHLIRIATDRYLYQEESSNQDGILALIGIGQSGSDFVSEKHDEVLAQLSRNSTV